MAVTGEGAGGDQGDAGGADGIETTGGGAANTNDVPSGSRSVLEDLFKLIGSLTAMGIDGRPTEWEIVRMRLSGCDLRSSGQQYSGQLPFS